jgi:predicted DNA-binding transcriptional regulator YafY
MRADRLLSVLMLLQARGRMTARELSERLEVSERTVYRDISALGMAGIPVYAERGPGGGCMLSEGYRTNLTGLSEAEARTLVLAMASRPLKDLGMGGALDAALLKLLAALPSRVRAGAEQARQRVHVDTAGWGAPEATPHLRALEEAVWQERRVRISYRDSGGKLAERVIEPLGLVAKASIWYLVAAVEGELRVYRVSRMRAVTPLDETFARLEGFDLAAYWEESSRRFQESWGAVPSDAAGGAGAAGGAAADLRRGRAGDDREGRPTRRRRPDEADADVPDVRARADAGAGDGRVGRGD